MKHLLGICMVSLFFTANVSAATVELLATCEDRAWAVAEYVYDQTGDGFDAGAAYEAVLAKCQAE